MFIARSCCCGSRPLLGHCQYQTLAKTPLILKHFAENLLVPLRARNKGLTLNMLHLLLAFSPFFIVPEIFCLHLEEFYWIHRETQFIKAWTLALIHISCLRSVFIYWSSVVDDSIFYSNRREGIDPDSTARFVPSSTVGNLGGRLLSKMAKRKKCGILRRQ